MWRPMILVLRALLLVALSCAFASTLAGAAISVVRAVDVRFVGARNRSEDACHAYRSRPRNENADVCREDAFGPKAIPRSVLAKKALAEARSAFDREEGAAARAAIAQALDLAEAADERGGVVAILVAADVLDETLNLLDERRDLVSPDQRRALLARVDLGAAVHPFEAERIHRTWLTFHSPPPLPGWLGRAAMLDDALLTEVALADMDRALAEGDLARCEAAGRSHDDARGGDNLEWMCRRFRKVVAIAARVEEARAPLSSPSAMVE